MHQSAIGNQNGFTLAEAAIVLAILAVVIGMLVPTFLSLRVAEQARATAQNLQNVMRAVAGYVQAAGCVPCPLGAGNANGDNQACGNCTVPVGLVPYKALGLPQSFAKDAYGRWLTYAVDTRLANYRPTAPDTALPVSGTHGMCSMTFSGATALNVRIENGVNNQNNIGVLVLSHGANGRGAYRAAPESDSDRVNLPNVACTSSAGGERCNANNNLNFVAGLPAQGNDPFDDLLLYLDRNALVTYLGNMPCATGWQ